MSTTDRAAFEQYAQSQGCNDFEYDQDDGQRYRNPFTQREYKYWRAALDWQAATEAAKATGTAELPSLPEGKAWASPLRYGSKIGFPKPVKPANWDDDDGVDWFCHPYFTADQMRAYGQQCAEAACRDKNGNHVSDLSAWLDEAKDEIEVQGAAFHATSLKLKIAEAELAARQPAPVSGMLKVVRGEICYKSEADDQSYGMWCPVTPDYSPAYTDGTEFCAALAATAAPVLSDEKLHKIWLNICMDEDKSVPRFIRFYRSIIAATRSQP